MSTTTRGPWLPVRMGVDVAVWNGITVERNTLRSRPTYTVQGKSFTSRDYAWVETLALAGLIRPIGQEGNAA